METPEKSAIGSRRFLLFVAGPGVLELRDPRRPAHARIAPETVAPINDLVLGRVVNRHDLLSAKSQKDLEPTPLPRQQSRIFDLVETLVVLVVLLEPANQVLDLDVGHEHRAKPVVHHAPRDLDRDGELGGEDLSRLENAGDGFPLGAGKEIGREETRARRELGRDAGLGELDRALPGGDGLLARVGKQEHERERRHSSLPRSILSTPSGI